MSVTGEPDGPPVRLGIPIVDLVSGLLAVQGILLALLSRGSTGRGRHVDISMLDAAAGLLTFQAVGCLATGENPARMGNAHANIVPYGTFEARDGLLVLAIGNDDQWRRFCAAAGLDLLASDERFATNPARVTHRNLLMESLTPLLRSRDRADWTARLRKAGVPCGAVQTVAETLADPQLLARNMVATVHHPAAGDVRLVADPVKLSDGPTRPDRPPPRLGEQTDAILMHELGMPAAEIEALRRRGVI